MAILALKIKSRIGTFNKVSIEALNIKEERAGRQEKASRLTQDQARQDQARQGAKAQPDTICEPVDIARLAVSNFNFPMKEQVCVKCRP